MNYSLTSAFIEREVGAVVHGTTVQLSNNISMVFERDENNEAVVYLVRDGKRRPIVVIGDEDTGVQLSVNGYTYSAEALSDRDKHFHNLLKETATTKSGNMKVVAPMPGLLKTVNVKAGQHVKKGERLFILEAMKMENDIIERSSMELVGEYNPPDSGFAYKKLNIVPRLPSFYK